MSETKSDVSATMQEIIGMTGNLEAIKTCQDLFSKVSIQASESRKVAQALFFLDGMKTGTEARIKELEAQLPKAAVSVAPAVEVAKGEPLSVA